MWSKKIVRSDDASCLIGTYVNSKGVASLEKASLVGRVVAGLAKYHGCAYTWTNSI